MTGHLGGGIPEDKERIIVKCRAEAEDEEGAQEFNICTIIGGVVESCHLDPIFDGYAEFYVEGSYPVHLTGYFMPDMDDDEMDGMYDRQMGDDEDDDPRMRTRSTTPRTTPGLRRPRGLRRRGGRR